MVEPVLEGRLFAFLTVVLAGAAVHLLLCRMNSATPAPSVEGVIAQARASGKTVFVHEGMVCAVSRNNDADCRRDDVELWADGRWQTLVTASLDWETEFSAEWQKWRARCAA